MSRHEGCSVRPAASKNKQRQGTKEIKTQPLFSFMTTRWVERPVIHPFQGGLWSQLGWQCLSCHWRTSLHQPEDDQGQNPQKSGQTVNFRVCISFFLVFRIPRNKKNYLWKKTTRLSHLKLNKQIHKIKLKSRVFCRNSGATSRDTLCFVIVQFHLEDMVVEVLLKMPCVKHGIRGENANRFCCL